MPVISTEKIKEKKRLVREFREFVDRGNVVELGVAFVMGATFKTIIDSFAGNGGDNPGILGGRRSVNKGGKTPNFNDKGVTLNGSFLPLGSLLTAAINFLLVSLAMFAVIRLYNRFRSGEANAKPAPTTNEILTEIRDELRRRP